MSKKAFMAAIITATLLLSFAVGIQTVQLAKADDDCTIALVSVEAPAQNFTYDNNMALGFHIKVTLDPTDYLSGPTAWCTIDDKMNVTCDIANISPNGTVINLSFYNFHADVRNLTNGIHQLKITIDVTYSKSPSRFPPFFDCVQTFPDIIPFEVNNTTPTFQVLSPENKTYNTANVPLTVDLSDGSTLFEHVFLPYWEYSVDGKSAESRVALYALSDGPHNVTVTYYSAFSQGTETVFFTVDTNPPNISDLNVENETYSVHDVPLSFSVNESTSWLGYSLDSQANVTIGGNVTLFGLPDGTHTIVIYANDTVGNTGKSVTAFFTVYTTTPSPKTEYSTELVLVAIIVLVLVGIGASAVYLKRRKREP